MNYADQMNAFMGDYNEAKNHVDVFVQSKVARGENPRQPKLLTEPRGLLLQLDDGVDQVLVLNHANPRS